MASQPAKPVQGVQVVEMHMLDKRKYFPLATLDIITRRSIVHPSVVIKTRLMVQKQKDIYKGTFDAFVKITKYEGTRGLYKGFGVGQLLTIPKLTYITTYETARNYLTKNNVTTSNKAKSLIGGLAASIVSQTSLVPLSVVVQRLMLIDNNKLHKAQKGQMIQIGDLQMSKESLQTPFGRTYAVCRSAYRTFGIRGFYKGYFVSLAFNSPHSALWWFFYDFYCSNLGSFSPDNVPRTILQTMAGPLAGATTCTITNPLELLKIRIQVQGKGLVSTARILWQEERFGLFKKGLSVRILHSITLSFLLVISYESIKKLSLLPEYKDAVRW